ncbi:MAG TPA: FAD-dependent oxidoreductase [Thermomicrobiales bacterium]|nr:FAD-dependent oxidoreductase [Thermomicrobiales bacterium]
MPRSDVAIVGGGVIGLATAWALVRRGAAVRVIDPGPPERAASFGNAGWIVPSLADPVPAPGLVGQSLRWMLRSDSPLYIAPRVDPAFLSWLVAFWRHCTPRAHAAGFAATARLGATTIPLYDRMRADGVQFEEHRDGLLFAYADKKALAHDHAALETLTRFGWTMPALLEGDVVREQEPALRPGLAGGYWLASERSVRPASLVRGLVAWLNERGVTFDAASATGLRGEGDRVGAVETTAGPIEADEIVVAAGAWTPRIVRSLGVSAPIEAGKGYHVDYVPPPAGVPALRQSLYLHESRVAITPLDGMVRLAGTMELSGLNDRIRPERVAALPARTAEFIAGWPIGVDGLRPWTGPRPMTPDGLPMIGRAKGWSNLTLASGHAMLGVTLAPATGEAVAELLATGHTPAIVAPFDPARFR